MNTQRSNIQLPKINHIKLENFSLYNLKPNIDIDLDKGVYCLAGANGLGKSTFLSALNFCLTGAVPNPKRKFKSVNEYYAKSFDYNNEYFSGRISEDDRDVASISISFSLNNKEYQIRRGVFDEKELRELTIIESANSSLIFCGKNFNGEEIQMEYEKNITNDIGLQSFSQFVFLQHYLFTFDESRHLLLWDQAVLTQVLYLCIGADYGVAQEADAFNRKKERAASLARNASWRASQIKNEIDIITKNFGITEEEIKNNKSIKEKHETLWAEKDTSQKIVYEKSKQIEDLNFKVMEKNAELSALLNQYSKEFEISFHNRSRVHYHPLIAASFSENKCALCNNNDSNVTSNIQEKIDAKECPLCSSSIASESDSNGDSDILKKIDEKINLIKSEIKSKSKSVERVSNELEAAVNQLDKIQTEFREFEKQNEEFIVSVNNSEEVNPLIDRKIKEREEFLKLKKEKYKERDEHHREYLKRQRTLERSYIAVHNKFIPLFKELANLFIGIDMDIRMDTSQSLTNSGLFLVLEMRGATRRKDHQFSESQKFFLDIALRMALSQFLASDQNSATLFIDTPEGSLDIAYENRAGKMFAQFVNSNNNMIMTANINTSMMLINLANECGSEKMKLHRMTSWAELSEVQSEASDLFHSAYNQIESKLNG